MRSDISAVCCRLGLERESTLVGAWIFEILETPSADQRVFVICESEKNRNNENLDFSDLSFPC
jgi:hypothetical protein